MDKIDQKICKPCFECGNPAEHDHHVVPQSLGGTKTVPLCTDCHAKVHNVHAIGTPALTKSGLAVIKRQNLQVGSVPYGYQHGEIHERITSRGGKRKNYKLIPNPAEQKVIALVRDLREQGFSIRGIASELDRREIPTRTSGKMVNYQGNVQKAKGKWTKTQIVRILAGTTPSKMESRKGIHDHDTPPDQSRDAFEMILE